ncbi:MAG: cytochrome c [Nitrospira sp.]|nr:cytochrome c [Nitrospira sp.]
MVLPVLLGMSMLVLIGGQPRLFKGIAMAASEEEIPAGYKAKGMPSGWHDDPKIRAAGKDVFEGQAKPDVNCARCHGTDGKPTRLGKGAPDLSDPTVGQNHSDEYWFWRISEKKPGSKMPGYKDKLSEEQRWQVIAYLRTLTQSGR